ncbi:hypothetical protein [Dyadobacter psychrotolerans]|uniref:Uncharacterized protein n=1 Tax=Dyadobacter psychrotolerans TaxID=2541721 RepID=A0A4R5DSQ1_9BACT|nr:hypothetical protein [Dyadobacter psychrotolerans]TDE15300.1 hypothetical protein E0F88_12310 [Dyadobacter psychrotolerans]
MKSFERWLKKKENRQLIFFVMGVIVLYFFTRKKAAEAVAAAPSYTGLRPGFLTGNTTPTTPTPTNPGTVTPLPDYTWTPGSADLPKGVYTTKVSGREYHYNKTPEFSIQITGNGITDNTPGLVRTAGGLNKLGDDNVFYAIGNFPLKNADGSYNNLQNYVAPDGGHTIAQYVMKSNKIPDLATFDNKFDGWNDGVNTDNGRMSQIFLSVHSDEPTANSIWPVWSVASRQLLWPSVAQPKNWEPYNKHHAVGHRNIQDSREKVIALGVQPYIAIGQGTQPGTFWTWMKGDSSIVSEATLKDMGGAAMEHMGNSTSSYLSSEIAENMQNNDPDIYGKTSAFYEGARIKKGTKKGNWGDYGGDQFYGYVRPELQWMTRENYEKSVTTHVHNKYDPTDGFSGISEFFTRNHHINRNVNQKYYLFQNKYHFPMEFAYVRNRVKVGTMTYQGQNNECEVSIFTCTKTESFVERAGGGRVGIEGARTGDIIPFPNGEIETKFTQVAAPWDEQFKIAFWSLILVGGSAMWDAPNSQFGDDTTKLHFWQNNPNDVMPRFRPTGGNWQNWTPGQNGQPGDSYTGLMHSMFAATQDAAVAAMEVVWGIRNRIKVPHFAAYTSSRGNFTPTPGTQGLHMNGGTMPINHNLFCERDILEGKKGFAIDCTGDGGGVVIYQNDFLAPHEYEDNVTVNGHNIGRVYGRQPALKVY